MPGTLVTRSTGLGLGDKRSQHVGDTEAKDRVGQILTEESLRPAIGDGGVVEQNSSVRVSRAG